MPTDLRSTYTEWLMSAQSAVEARDKAAAMFCLGQAMRCANRVHDDARYRKAVLRALSFTRRLP